MRNGGCFHTWFALTELIMSVWFIFKQNIDQQLTRHHKTSLKLAMKWVEIMDLSQK